MSQLFSWGGQSIGVSALSSFLTKNTLVGSPCSPRDSQESSPTPQFKSINSSALSLLYGPTLTSIHDYGKTIALTRQNFVGKVMSLLFNMLSRFVIAVLPGSKCLLISWLQSPSVVILEPIKNKIKSVTISIVSQSICHETMRPDAMIIVFWMLSFKPAFSLSYFIFIKKLFISSSLSVISVLLSAYLCYWYFSGNIESSLCFTHSGISHDVLYIGLLWSLRW